MNIMLELFRTLVFDRNCKLIVTDSHKLRNASRLVSSEYGVFILDNLTRAYLLFDCDYFASSSLHSPGGGFFYTVYKNTIGYSYQYKYILQVYNGNKEKVAGALLAAYKAVRFTND